VGAVRVRNEPPRNVARVIERFTSVLTYVLKVKLENTNDTVRT
jgi:hypothetical protein